MASWSPRNRRYSTMTVLNEEGDCALEASGAAHALHPHSPPSLRGLQRHRFCSGGPHEGFSKCLSHCPHSAPGPEGVAQSACSHAGPHGASARYDCCTALREGSQVPAVFNEAYLMFVPKAGLEDTGPVMGGLHIGLKKPRCCSARPRVLLSCPRSSSILLQLSRRPSGSGSTQHCEPKACRPDCVVPSSASCAAPRRASA